MGTEKRQRQKEGRQARIAAAEAAQRKAATRQRILSFAGLAALIVVLIFAITYFTRDDSTDVASTDTTIDTLDPSSSSSVAPLESAAGKPCVALSDPLPTGAPDVPVQVGPPPTELVKEDLVVGTGDEVVAGATVTVNYIGVACSTGAIFDSSYESGKPVTFPLDQVIAGWTDGIPGMKVGGQRLLGIPSELAYGADGSPPAIAPDEALWFVVEVTNTVAPTTTTTAPASGGSSTTTASTPS